MQCAIDIIHSGTINIFRSSYLTYAKDIPFPAPTMQTAAVLARQLCSSMKQLDRTRRYENVETALLSTSPVRRIGAYKFKALTSATPRSFVAAQCIAPLGMESGTIPDTDINASSSFDTGNVGPHLAR
ncbi:hypothetical protein ALC53_07258 [Atta colombica]|uniref:F5/8 type C domain-containing protein n=1 Tax=Atta colombica TaxID=520822 RepID=A0A195BDH5_9HYME|nr:hypothetical protein ALC53_07258 [Atta colombica]